MNRILFFVLIFLITEEIAAQHIEGLSRMAHPELLPYLFHPGTQTKQSASVDYSGNNDDGNYKTAFIRYKDENGEDVIFDEFGPGCIYRMQMNAWTRWLNTVTVFPQAGKARIKFYFDNEQSPRINTTLDSLYTTMMKPFIKPFNFIDGLKRFAVSYYPIEFEKRLKITIVPVNDWSERGNTWYQFTYLTYPENSAIKSWTGRGDSSAIVQQWSNVNKDPKSFGNLNTIHKNLSIKSGASEEVIIKGGGAISSMH
ncbi:MAG: hypothetical protein J7497_13485, partial [Chitinophagaceae bacterium]|nr:hypothetical protein [Chitinophagaceae bacterium]